MLRATGHEPVALLCVRHDEARYTALGELVRAAPPEIDIVMPATRDRIAPLLRHFDPDVAVCLGFPWKIPSDALAVPRHGIVNGHPSLLPRYRGPEPRLVGDPQRGDRDRLHVPLHGRRVDTGNILGQARIPLADEHGWEELTPKVADAVGNMVPGVLERVERGEPGEPQDESAASYFHLFEPDYAWIDRAHTTWMRSSARFERGASTREFLATAAPSSSTVRRCAFSE